MIILYSIFSQYIIWWLTLGITGGFSRPVDAIVGRFMA